MSARVDEGVITLYFSSQDMHPNKYKDGLRADSVWASFCFSKEYVGNVGPVSEFAAFVCGGSFVQATTSRTCTRQRDGCLGLRCGWLPGFVVVVIQGCAGFNDSSQDAAEKLLGMSIWGLRDLAHYKYITNRYLCKVHNYINTGTASSCCACIFQEFFREDIYRGLVTGSPSSSRLVPVRISGLVQS